MRTFTTALALLGLAAAPASARDAIPASAKAHLEHLAHAGLGTPIPASKLKGLPKRYAAIERGEKAERKTKRRLTDERLAVRAGYKDVSVLTNGAFPKFYPGLGSVFVRPKSLPLGPFLTFDHRGRQVATVYMPSLAEMNEHKKFDAVGLRKSTVDHVTLYYHGGHPGVDYPHYHYVLWHMKNGENDVKK